MILLTLKNVEELVLFKNDCHFLINEQLLEKWKFGLKHNLSKLRNSAVKEIFISLNNDHLQKLSNKLGTIIEKKNIPLFPSIYHEQISCTNLESYLQNIKNNNVIISRVKDDIFLTFWR